MTKEIKLTKEQVTLIDGADFELVSGYKWHAHFSPCTQSFYARTNIPCTNDKSGSETHLLHRLLMNPTPGLQVDHINGNTLDNRRENLRVVSQADNQKNKRKQHTNTSGFKGVSFHKRAKKWAAYINVFTNGKSIRKHLGYFDSALEASKNYEAAAAKYFGEYNRSLEHR